MNTNDLLSLTGKLALVTGGGRGIGEFIARGLAEAGANLIIVSRKKSNLEEAAVEIASKYGVEVLPIVCDLGKIEDINNLIDIITNSHKRIDILINNAGVTWGAPTLEYPLAKWDQLFNINVRSVWILTQKIANLMKEQGGGNIINISSIFSYRGTDEKIHPAVPYNSAKAAINLLTMNLAVKLAHFNIRVNAIAPGFFRTEMMSYVEKPEYVENYSEMLNQIPMRRFGEINDIKAVAVFLASDAAAYITGHVLAVDGGYLAR